MRGYEAAQILKEKGITVEDVAEEITYRKETNAFSNNPKNEAFMNMTLNELVRIKRIEDKEAFMARVEYLIAQVYTEKRAVL